MFNFSDISEALIVGNAPKVKLLVETALSEGTAPADIITKGLIPGMAVVGERFKINEIYVPEVLIAARAMNAGLNIVKPLLAKGDFVPLGKVAIGTVKGDLHDIGKNLVAMMLEGNGFEIVDLGIDVSSEKFVNAVIEKGVTHVAMSALLTTTMPSMKDTIDALKAAGVRDKVKVMIGGAPVTQKYSNEIGADGYSSDASSAVDLAKALMA